MFGIFSGIASHPREISFIHTYLSLWILHTSVLFYIFCPQTMIIIGVATNTIWWLNSLDFLSNVCDPTTSMLQLHPESILAYFTIENFICFTCFSLYCGHQCIIRGFVKGEELILWFGWLAVEVHSMIFGWLYWKIKVTMSKTKYLSFYKSLVFCLIHELPYAQHSHIFSILPLLLLHFIYSIRIHDNSILLYFCPQTMINICYQLHFQLMVFKPMKWIRICCWVPSQQIHHGRHFINHNYHNWGFFLSLWQRVRKTDMGTPGIACWWY